MTGDKGVCALDAWASVSAFGSCSAETSDAEPGTACAAITMDGLSVCTYTAPLSYSLSTPATFLSMTNSDATAKVDMRT